MKQFEKISIIPQVGPHVELPQPTARATVAREMLSEVDAFADSVDLLLKPEVVRDDTHAINRLGLVGRVPGAGAVVEVHRGEEGVSPNTVDTLYPDERLCYDALEDIIRNYRAWNDTSVDPDSEW